MPTYHLARYGYIAARWDVSVEAESEAEAIAKVDSDNPGVDWACGFDWSEDIQHFDDPGERGGESMPHEVTRSAQQFVATLMK